MASGGPMVNGDVSLAQSITEETLQQMNILIQENQNLKELLQQNNLKMKEHLEGLSMWRDKHLEERGFLEEARGRIEALSRHNQELSRRLEEEQGRVGEAEREAQVALANQMAELDALRTQLARLQAEKNDLVAMNSELQLKMGQESPGNSFIKIDVMDGEVDEAKDLCADEWIRSLNLSMTASQQKSEDLTVSQLLQSLRNETQRTEQLQADLRAAGDRITELEERRSNTEQSTQTSQPETQVDSGKEEKVESEVENLKSQMMTLRQEKQQALSKLDEAEGTKKSLQDRCLEVEREVVTLRAQLVEKQAVQAENVRLKLQLDSKQVHSQLEQKRAEEERKNLAQLEDAYTKLFEDYNELKEEKKERESQVVQREVVEELQGRLAAAEQALATKQDTMDILMQEIYNKEEELGKIPVFQAQAEVYSADFFAERAAREKIHEEKERLATELEFMKEQNIQLQEEITALGSRQSLNEMQRRYVLQGSNPHGGAAAPGGRGGDVWQQQGTIREHTCPKCCEILPDLDSLQIHIMDCII